MLGCLCQGLLDISIYNTRQSWENAVFVAEIDVFFFAYIG